MKNLKILGLAVLAATVLTAFLGAGSASATVLCKTAENPCPEGQKWSIGTALEATSEHIFFYNTNTCVASTIKAKNTGNGGSGLPVPLSLEGLSFSTCTRNTLVTTLGEMQIEWITGTHSGVVTSRGAKGTFSMPLGSCAWSIGFGGAWVDIGTIYGGSPAEIELEAPLTTICPFTHITGTYTVPTPEPLYIESS